DLFQRLAPDHLDAPCQHRLRRILPKAQPTKGAIARRISQVKRKLAITETVHLLDHQCSQYLLSTEAFSPGLLPCPFPVQILPNQLRNGRHLIENAIDHRQLRSVLQGEPWCSKIELFLTCLAHSARAPEIYLF